MQYYLATDQKTIDFNNQKLVSEMYNNGFVFTRLGKGIMQQTRSLRINLDKFELSSENRRILRKTESLSYNAKTIPYEGYTWEIHKLGKDYYSTKFGDSTMSASKIKELFTDSNISNMNLAFEYIYEQASCGYCLCYQNEDLLHYSYPFYDLNLTKDYSNLGMGMMLKAILWSFENNHEYLYLGSVVAKESLYKLQFKGLEWFNTETKSWSEDLEALKNLILQN